MASNISGIADKLGVKKGGDGGGNNNNNNNNNSNNNNNNNNNNDRHATQGNAQFTAQDPNGGPPSSGPNMGEEFSSNQVPNQMQGVGNGQTQNEIPPAGEEEYPE